MIEPVSPVGLDDQQALDLLPMGVAHVDAVGTIRLANRMGAEMLGLTPTEAVGRNLFEFAIGDLDRYAQMLDFSVGFTRAIMGPLRVEYRNVDGIVGNSSLWAWNHLDDPEVEAIVCVFVPEATEAGISAALTSIAEGDDVDRTLGLLAGSLRGNPFSARGCWLIHDADGSRLSGDDGVRGPIRAALAQRGAWWRATRSDALVGCDDTRIGDEDDRLLAAAGVAAWWALPCRGAEDRDAAIVVLRESPGPISPNQIEHLEQLVTTAGLAFERASMQERLAHAAYHDPLTGLGNRGRFFHRDHEQLPPGAALLYVDLDHFKPVNDRLGHTAGDLVLVTVADRIRRAVRPSDRITRFGGDEFVVECDGVSSDAEAIDIAERIIATVEEPIALDLATIRVGASVGIARTDAGATLDEVLDRSDAALLAAKAAGKNRWHLASDVSGG